MSVTSTESNTFLPLLASFANIDYTGIKLSQASFLSEFQTGGGVKF